MPLSNKKLFLAAIFIIFLALTSSCARKVTIRPINKEKGLASWYGPGFHGRKTASGERYNQWGMTAAHNVLPFGTMVKVVNLDNMKSCIVRINDRGPHGRGRIIDLSKAAAKEIGLLGSGVAKVIIFYLPEVL